MSHIIQYDPNDHIVSLILYGREDGAGILAMVADLAKVSKKNACERVVTDMRECDLNISMMEVYSVLGQSISIVNETGVNIYRIRHAIVAHEQQLMPHYYETIAQEFGHPAKVFQDLEDAKAWLKVWPSLS